MGYRFVTAAMVAALAVVAVLLPSAASAQSQRCFDQTSFCISGPIRTYWERKGGLAVFGYPTTAQRAETVEGRTLQVQWFERDRLEIQADGTITGGRLGARWLELQGRPWQQFASEAPNSSSACRYFDVTRFNVCGLVRTYWETHGGLERFGYPISPMTFETIEGNQYSVQYFERRRIELHPENRPPYDILLGLLGREILNMQGGSQPAANTLAGTSWRWVKLTDPTQQTEIPDPDSYTLTFIDATNLNIKADCNSVHTTYTADVDGTLAIAPGPSTSVACAPGSRGDEFVKRLGAAAHASIQNGHLFIDQAANGGTLEFAPSTAASTLAGTSWQWIKLSDPTQRIDIENPSNYTLTFMDATNLSIKADCNSVRASYTAKADGTLKITPGPSTRVACPPGSRGDDFVKLLGAATRVSIQNGHLFIDQGTGGSSLEFAPSAAAGLVGTSWQWVKLADATQQVAIQNPGNYTITFVDATNLSIKADCNSVRASYTAMADGTLAITPGPSTLVACAPASRGDEFVKRLAAAAGSFMQNGHLFINQMDNGGTLEFAPK